VVHLQVQRSSLKVVDGDFKWYDPAPLFGVDELELSEDGVVGCTPGGELIVDVHNRRHPASKNGDKNGISFGFTSHYAALRGQFGAHLTDGIAGENILIASETTISLEDAGGGVVIETGDGQCIELERILVAEPCVPFTRYALRYERDAPQDSLVTESLRSLRYGRRGFYATCLGPPGCIHPGDQVFARPI
jgi:hypothetical protein